MKNEIAGNKASNTAKLLLGVFALAIISTTAPAAMITWGPPTTISSDSDVSTDGTLDRAFTFVRPDTSTGSFGSATVNGVTFAIFGAASDPPSVTIGNTTVTAVGGSNGVESFNGLGSSSNPFASLSADYRLLLSTAGYNDGGGLTLQLDGLAVGQPYQFQVFVNDSRNDETRTETVTAGNTVSLAFSSTQSEGGVGQFVIGTFTAGNSGSQSITFTNQNPQVGSASQINGFQLRAVPEPSTGSATWKTSPGSKNWNTASNWTPATVPNGPSRTATFATSNKTGVSISAQTEVNGIVFNAGASAFTITAKPTFFFTLSGVGITNNSGLKQNFGTAVDGAGNRERYHSRTARQRGA